MQTRHLSLTDLHTRESDDGDHLEFEGQAVPYNSPIVYSGIQERFAAGSVDETDAVGKPILWGHDRQELIGSIQSARNTDDGLQVTGTIEATSRGRDVIQLMRKGHLKGLSIGFTPTETDRTPQGLTYTRAQLHELSLTPLPAYGDQSLVTATREEDIAMSESTETREAPQVDLAPLTERLDQLESRMARAADTQVREIAPLEALAMQMRDAAESKSVRALGDVISGGNAGVLPPSWANLLRGYLDGTRYLTPRLGNLGFPATGHTLTVPGITTEPTVGPRGTELTAIPGTGMATGSDTFTAQWLSGGVRVALELISQSSPEASAVAVQRLMLAYSRQVDDYLGTTLADAGTATGAIDFTDYGTVVDSILTAAHTIRNETGAMGDKLALTEASWKKLIGLVDADGRRILSVSGSSNADGAAGLTSLSVNIGGVEAFYYLGSIDLQFNSMSAAYAEKPPLTLSEVEVGVMGRSIGVLGAVIALPLYPAGIIKHAAIG